MSPRQRGPHKESLIPACSFYWWNRGLGVSPTCHSHPLKMIWKFISKLVFTRKQSFKCLVGNFVTLGSILLLFWTLFYSFCYLLWFFWNLCWSVFMSVFLSCPLFSDLQVLETGCKPVLIYLNITFRVDLQWLRYFTIVPYPYSNLATWFLELL